ncbi:ABC transporter substrate-binding protein [Dictyobacter vulcani]|uniref:ABC transporter substrate-binding protein n=1 Tax=Dictyobacter vulcani TaxID=2607529 RepID=A0A5J4KNT7_9CHLR|nr:sugar ABC transporter substrate-binding protein [Dictyobacter vulcani]GER88011.1 ABC transporter substrate-binding protein [Dictyobacter vulcani]
MRRKFATFSPFFLILALLLAACGGASDNGGSTGSNGSNGNNGVSQQGIASGNHYINCPGSTNTTAADPEKDTVTLTVSGWTSTPAEDALVQKNLQSFEASHPNIKLKWSPITGDYPTKMRANVASNNVADVFYLQPSMSSSYISAGKLLNLSPYMAKGGVKAEDYYSALINPFTCTSGQVYGLPKDWNSLGVFYNKKLFKDAGVTAPAAGWTWSDMQKDAQKLTKNAGQSNATYGITLPADMSRWGAFLLANGGSVLSKDGTKATFNNPAGVQALDYYNSFFKNKTGILPTTVGASYSGDAFGKERAAMVIEGGWLIPYLHSTYANTQYGIAPMPTSNSGKQANLTFTNAWAASASTKHAEASWELIKYMTGSTVQESQLNAGFALPALKSLANAPYFTSHPDVKVLFDAASYSYADYYGPQDATIHTDLSNAIDAVVLNKQTSQAALDDAATRINSQLQNG